MALDKKFNPRETEQKLYKKWEESGVFACNVKSNKKPYTIPMPPPNVTGSLHMGHALNTTLQDILVRYQRMKGCDVLWQPGTDHAGIATQMVVEKQLAEQGISRHDLGREKFVEKVWEWKEESGSTITTQLRRLGASPDWGRERFTLDDGLSRAVRKVFVQLHKEKLIYKDKRLVNWDPKLHTAISDLEVEQKETKSYMWHFRYPLEGEESRYITVATTRPETMFGDTAIAVHPDDERYKDLIGKFAILPIVNRPIPIIADEHADPEQGSGAVKITPAHDFNDFEVGKRHKLEMIDIFDLSACLNENVPEEYQGMDRFKARKKILEEMEALEYIDKVDDHVYMLPYSERSGVVIEPRLTDQWYCDAPTLAKPAIEAVKDGRTEFVPKNWDKTYFEWMNNIQPWCISRQLWWGHRIPAWYGPDDVIFVEETVEEAEKAAHEHYGEEVELRQETDVLDTWFSSALWPFSTLGWPDVDMEEVIKRYYPADTLITGFDIIFFWVARMMMMGMHFMGDVPFKKVYIHALVRDEKGQKMSKSKGNVMDPLDLIDEYGADALRFTLTAMAAQGRDVKLATGRVEGYRNFTTKLWNAARYCEMNECHPVEGFDPSSVKQTINQWIVSELAEVSCQSAKAIEEYKFNEVANGLYQFALGLFCDWYIEFTKPLLSSDDKEMRDETRATTGWVLDQLMILLNPIMPYLTEELHANLTGKDDQENWLISQSWPEFDDSIINSKSQDEMNLIVRIITEIRKVRADMNIRPGAVLEMLIKEDENDAFKKHIGLISRLARVEENYKVADDNISGCIQIIIDDLIIFLNPANGIDVAQERARIQKDIEKISVDIQKIENKLSNENFLAKAPKEVVEEQHARKAEAENVISKLNHALEQLDVA